MTPLNFVIVGLRLIGIYFILQSGPLFAAMSLIAAFMVQLAGSTTWSSATTLVSALISGGFQLLIGITLIAFATRLARRIVPPSMDSTEKVGCSLEEFQVTAFAAVGILILANALPSLGRVWSNLHYWFNLQQQTGSASPSPDAAYNPTYLAYSFGIIAQIIIGLFLLLSPQGFRNIWHWLRTAGTQPKE